MSRTRLAVLGGLSALAAASASFAQTGGQAPAGDQVRGTGAMTCRQMADEVSAKMNAMTNERKKALAMRDVEMAKAAMAQKQEAACKMHAQRAMDLMK